LAAYVGDDLPPDEADAVRAHVARCAACGAEEQRFAESMAALRRAGDEPSPAFDAATVWQAVRRATVRTAETARRPAPVRRRMHVGVLVAAAAAAVAFAATTLLIHLPGSRRSDRTAVAPGPYTAPPRVEARVPQDRLAADRQPQPFDLENFTDTEAGAASGHLDWLPVRDQTRGEEFVLEQVQFQTGAGQRMSF
jgi:hypothetical protein